MDVKVTDTQPTEIITTEQPLFEKHWKKLAKCAYTPYSSLKPFLTSISFLSLSRKECTDRI